MVKLKKTEALYKQIAFYFEKEIAEGRLGAGDKIPATAKLAKVFGVNADTVQQSQKLLMSQGLIDRKPGRGTYVKHGINSKTLGIVFGKGIYANIDAMFFPTFLDSLVKIFESKGWACKLFATSELDVYDKIFYELKSSVNTGEVRAIIDFCANNLVANWIKTESSVISCQNPLTIDYYEFVYLGLEYLNKHGANSIAFLAHLHDNNIGEYKKAISDFCANYGVDKDNICIYPVGTNAKDGYNLTKDIYTKNIKFDGLLIGNDGTLRGVLYALLELGIGIGTKVKLLTYANKGVDIFSHIPLTKLEFDSNDFAEEVYKELSAKIKGEKMSYRPVKSKLIPGKSCGE